MKIKFPTITSAKAHPHRRRLHAAISAAALVFAVCAIRPVSAGAQPQVQWVSTTIDFGAFDESNGPVSAVFRGVNTGDAPLVVLDARANCGCTRPTYSTNPVAPGDTLRINVTYDPEGRPGRFSKNVFIDTNTPEKRNKLLIKGVVIGDPTSVAARFPVEMGPLRLRHSAAIVGSVDKGRLKAVFEPGYNTSPRALVPTITDVPEWLSVNTSPDTLAPGEQFNLTMYVDGDKTPLYGVVSDTITIVPDSCKPDESYRLPVVVSLREDFSGLTDAARLVAPVARFDCLRRDLGKTTDRTARAEFVLNNDGKTPLLIRRLYCVDPSVTVTADKTAVGPGSRALITVTASLTPGKPLNVRIQAIVNDPAAPVQNLRVTAEP